MPVSAPSRHRVGRAWPVCWRWSLLCYFLGVLGLQVTRLDLHWLQATLSLYLHGMAQVACC
ncbi:hypothetical protein [Xanthomonas albilineans]|uniref:hypothetical protein n=1 Tax=Xanthomonas albilineans TaxID=29447 RepID=UPI000B00D6BE|nr:hypothetical protein [Xanthomonas albilineans]